MENGIRYKQDPCQQAKFVPYENPLGKLPTRIPYEVPLGESPR